MGLQEQIIDSYLGQGSYAEWQKMEGDVRELKARYDSMKHKIAILGDQYTFFSRIWSDVYDLEAVAKSYRSLMNRIINGEIEAKNKVAQVYSILSESLSLVEEELDLTEGIYAFNFSFAIFNLSYYNLLIQVGQLSEILVILTHQLKVAENELKAADIKAAISIAVTLATALAGPLGLLKTIGIQAGKWGIGYMLGGPDKSMAEKIGSKITPVGKIIGEHISTIERYGKETRMVGGSVGKSLKIVGFFFDVDEMLIGCRNKENIKRQMAQALSSYNTLTIKIQDFKPLLNQQNTRCERFWSTVESSLTSIDNLRNLLRNDKFKTGYQDAY